MSRSVLIRPDPAAREEQYERLYMVLVDANKFNSSYNTYHVGDANTKVPLENAFNDIVSMLADRNPDFYEEFNGELRKVQS